ncbi:hypothetical protein HETIRDRAFT_422103 [Heterobasidion irregulare TC 32-1]|uniref:Uncharacterized protein n=1 Tax=Heterobasidion irregulare (strain TC 32-1) TaxID=747525 RepID=W4JT13_HETIT|nr:uncharacterized protein HETIRDRAFT_422103 [Heterobasidion irregulare TC 32-1]ETW76702.1 hypothetical protein HETIRDRAFT_422103 [Heterobasidion irregulare TC 32-1]
MIPTTTLTTTLTPPTDITTVAVSVFTIAPPTSSLAAASTLATTPTSAPAPTPTSVSTPTSMSMPAIILVPMIAPAPTPMSAPAATVTAMPPTLQMSATMQASTMVPMPPSESSPATTSVPSTITPTLTSMPMLMTLASVSPIPAGAPNSSTQDQNASNHGTQRKTTPFCPMPTVSISHCNTVQNARQACPFPFLPTALATICVFCRGPSGTSLTIAPYICGATTGAGYLVLESDSEAARIRMSRSVLDACSPMLPLPSPRSSWMRTVTGSSSIWLVHLMVPRQHLRSIGRACRQNADWHTSIHKHTVSINVSNRAP